MPSRSHRERVVGGKRRKYYVITATGRRGLREARGKIHELVQEVVEGQGPKRLLRRVKRRPM